MNRKKNNSSSTLRTHMERAKAEYLATTYDGDLAADLLPPERRRLVMPIVGGRRRWFMPVLTGAMAAMVAVVVWHRATGNQGNPDGFPGHKPIVIDSPRTQPSTATAPSPTPRADPDNVVYALKQLRYEAYVDDVRTGVHQAVDQVRVGVDRALAAPIVTDSVETVDHVKGQIKQMASETWSQMRAGKNSRG